MPKRKQQQQQQQHPLDASGVLEAAKYGRWNEFRQQLAQSADVLTVEHLNDIPPGRSFGVIHQICYHGNDGARQALEHLLEEYPRVDLKLPAAHNDDDQTPRQVAQDEGAEPAFLDYLEQRLELQTHHELINHARDGQWTQVSDLLDNDDTRPSLTTLNTVPEGRIWGLLHQVAYWGHVATLEHLCTLYDDDANTVLNLELETREDDAAQVPRDIAIGRGRHDFATLLQNKIVQQQQQQQQNNTTNTTGETEEPAPPSKVTAASSAMKTPVPAAGKLCRICYTQDHDEGTLAVACDNDHYLCQECFSGWVRSESDIAHNPQNILLNGGRITCPCAKVADIHCDSLAYANKLIALTVSDEEIYEQYLRARDYVVGKEAVAGALSKIQQHDGSNMNAVEQESIRNLYKLDDGTYSAYMCAHCSFGPIDHGWCNNLQSHHGEQKAGGGNINNACPQCGWFAASIAKWPKWDGQFQSSHNNNKNSTNKKLHKPAVATMTVMELKMALKSRGAPSSGNKATLQARLQFFYDQEKTNLTS